MAQVFMMFVWPTANERPHVGGTKGSAAWH